MNRAVELFIKDTMHYGQRYEERGMYVIRFNDTRDAVNYDGDIFKVWMQSGDWHIKRLGTVWEIEQGLPGTYTPGRHDGTYRREFYFDHRVANKDLHNVVEYFGRGNDKVF